MAPLEQWLYLPMSEYLAGWSGTQVPEHPAIRIVGEQWAESSHALRDVLSRSNIPYEFHAHDSGAGRSVLESANQDGNRLPVLQFFTGVALVDPTATELVEALGFRSSVDGVSCDIAIIGAGPSGMSAAVYAGSEGLRTALVEPGVPGGQAGTSSMIRNYLGFPRGLSGAELTNRAIEQAWLLGTEIILAQEVVSLRAEGDERLITSADGGRLRAGAVVIATGVSWRRLGVQGIESLLGSGVFYGAAGSEAEAMEGKRVYVVGGGNSAGQAAIHLAKYADSTSIMIRRDSLAHTMSDYLIQEIEALPNVEVRTNTEIVDGCGRGRLEELILRDRLTGDVETVAASGLFVMIGGEPRTDWLAGTLARDDRGYLLTGADIEAFAAGRARGVSGKDGTDADGSAPWPLARSPGFVETSMPGVFAVGDVRHGSTKRIAPSVGAGGIAVQHAHEYLAGLSSR